MADSSEGSPTGEDGHSAGRPRRSVVDFLELLMRLLLALGGPQLLTAFAPPMENMAVVRIVLLCTAAFAWFFAWWSARKYVPGEPAWRRNFRRNVLPFIAIAMVLLVGFKYANAWEEYTVEFDNLRLVTGDELTQLGSDYYEKNPNATRTDAVFAAGGSCSAVWTAASIRSVQFWLFLEFYALMFFAVWLVVFVTYRLPEKFRR